MGISVNQEDFTEECWSLYGLRTITEKYVAVKVSHTYGGAASVPFDWKEALSKNLIGWIHTHAPGNANMSAVDHKTMMGWAIALGKPIMCLIRSGNDLKGWSYWKSADLDSVIRVPLKLSTFGPLIFIGYRPNAISRCEIFSLK